MGPPAINKNLRWGISKRPDHGFTLVEFLVVIMVLGIAVMILQPTISQALDRSRLFGAVDQIITALEFAQMRAMTSGSQTRVTIDAGTDTVIIEQFKPDADLLGEENELSAGDAENGSYGAVKFPLNPGTDYSLTFAGEDRFKNVDIASASFGADNYVVFNPLGTPSQGGTVLLTTGMDSMVLTLGAATVTRSAGMRRRPSLPWLRWRSSVIMSSIKVILST
jgi:prepilin-type N-terminal cleavage/methylation domain-containing protein